jgi:copper chaperone NosL
MRARSGFVAIVALFALAACGRRDAGPSAAAVAIEKGDTCAVCGMYIEGQPGPRGEAYETGLSRPLKFGSTRDFFAFVTQPDEVHRLGALYVQDTARIDWAHPSDMAASFTDARTAFYVAWQPKPGAMGPTFAPFAKRAEAEAFRARNGGVLLRFDQVTPAVVSALDYRCPTTNSPLHALTNDCLVRMSAGTKPSAMSMPMH